MATPTENWPKPWVLSIHERAVAEGFVWVEPISKEDADSLRSRAYRMRRRSDKSMAAFVPPEYHLVMIGQWEPTDENGSGRLPFIYNKRADGQPLPTIRAASGEELSAFAAAPAIPSAPAVVTPTVDDLIIQPEEIDDLVSSLRKAARNRQQQDGG